jgi:hypothetical protein
MPVSAIPDVTLSAVTIGAGGSTSTVAGGTEIGSTLGVKLGATLLVRAGAVDVVGAATEFDGAGGREIATAELAPGFITAT